MAAAFSCSREPQASQGAAAGQAEALSAAAPSALSSGAAATRAASSRSAQKLKPWFAGKWSGTYTVKKHDPLLGKNEGQQLAWVKDRSKSFVGEGRVELMIEEDGQVLGTGSGPLGASQFAGRVSEPAVHLVLQPQQNGFTAFSGTAAGAFEKERIVLELRAASANGGFIRSGAAMLEKSDSQ